LETIKDLIVCLKNWEIIVALYGLREREDVRIETIREKVPMDKSAISKSLKMLSQLGIVKSAIDKGDRRIKYFKLSPKGVSLYLMAQELVDKFERLEKQEKKKVEVSEEEFRDNLEEIEELIEKQKELEGKREKIESELKRLEIGERGEKAEELKKTLKEHEINLSRLQYRLEKLRTYLRHDSWYDEIKGLTPGKGKKSFLDKALEEPEKYKEVLTILFDEAYKGFVEKAGARKLREKLKDKWNEEKEKEKMLRAVEKLESESGLRFLIEEAGAIDELTKVSSKWLRIRLCRMHEYLYRKLGAKVEHVYEQMLEDEDDRVKTAALEALKNIEELKRPY